ncbi:hypothetical protein [Oceanicaulis sp.]|uniref:hypothetical protein n=1 Tax=Oceanicaulis sp. TaxID=1924941 RepID=UPI003D2CE282
MLEMIFIGVIAIASGLLVVAAAHGLISTLIGGFERDHEKRRKGLGLHSFWVGEVPNGRERPRIHCGNGVAGRQKADGTTVYHKKARVIV